MKSISLLTGVTNLFNCEQCNRFLNYIGALVHPFRGTLKAESSVAADTVVEVFLHKLT